MDDEEARVAQSLHDKVADFLLHLKHGQTMPDRPLSLRPLPEGAHAIAAREKGSVPSQANVQDMMAKFSTEDKIQAMKKLAALQQRVKNKQQRRTYYAGAVRLTPLWRPATTPSSPPPARAHQDPCFYPAQAKPRRSATP